MVFGVYFHQYNFLFSLCSLGEINLKILTFYWFCNILRVHFFYSQFWNENGWYRIHSQHSVHSAPESRMDGMALCPFQNMNVE